MQNIKAKGSTMFTTARMTRIAVLGAISIVLSITPLGYIPVSLIGLQITFMHVPVIIASIVDGYTGGIIVGLIFGITSLIHGQSTILAPVLINPMVSVVPRIFIGVISAWVYKKTKNSGITAIAGTFSNTALFLTAVYFFALPAFASVKKISTSIVAKTLCIVGVTNGIPEIIFAFIIVTAVMKAISKVKK